MAGKRIKPIPQFLSVLMDENGCLDLRSFAAAKGIDERTIYAIADGQADKASLRKHKEIASRLGLSLDDYAKAWLDS